MNNAVTQRGTVTTGGQQQGWAFKMSRTVFIIIQFCIAGLAGRVKSWARKKWMRMKICRNKNAAPRRVVQQRLSPCLSAAQLHTLQLRSTSPKPPCGIPEQHHTKENSPAAAQSMLVNQPPSSTHSSPRPHSPKLLVRFLSSTNALTVTLFSPSSYPVQDPEEYTVERLQEEMAPHIVLQDCVLEDIEDEEPLELPVGRSYRPVEVLQDCVLEDIEEEELQEWPVGRSYPPVEVLQDCVLEDIEEEETLEWPVGRSYHRPVKVLHDCVLETIEEEELLELPVSWSYHRPVEVFQDCILEDIEEEEPLTTATAASQPLAQQPYSREHFHPHRMLSCMSAVSLAQGLTVELISLKACTSKLGSQGCGIGGETYHGPVEGKMERARQFLIVVCTLR
ncbi:hypothetical protein P7K49_003152 [Saguinus oedipus]|uniref:Uncharacterized protein n=1 Tax=Saguinus oedipus TaxID=9490 RepID=A0ABQ9WJC8_SAGOE|nr:hypothetical protein P7K49_003152 [Saguinus oedipus]